MVGSTTALVSVRGEARAIVAPDFAALSGVLKATRDTKAEALQVASAELKQLTDDLASLGGVPLTADTQATPLAWAAYSAGTELERDEDKQTGRYGPTGRVVALVSVSLTVRAFDLLDRLSDALASHEALHVHYVAWGVDSDNPSWPEVRAAAIQNAINKGRNYAETLGGSLDHLEHIADVGLLGDDGGMPAQESRRVPLAASAGGGTDSPSLDPVPQELIAIIEARFVATVTAL